MNKITSNTPVSFGMLSDASDVILKGMQSMFDDLNKNLDKKFGKLELDIKYNHNQSQKQIEDLKNDTPTIKEFSNLRNKVDRFYPTA